MSEGAVDIMMRMMTRMIMKMTMMIYQKVRLTWLTLLFTRQEKSALRFWALPSFAIICPCLSAEGPFKMCRNAKMTKDGPLWKKKKYWCTQLLTLSTQAKIQKHLQNSPIPWKYYMSSISSNAQFRVLCVWKVFSYELCCSSFIFCQQSQLGKEL